MQATSLQSRLSGVLLRAAEEGTRAGLSSTFAVQLERLAAEIQFPCTVAVVGRVKAGKSSFINAHLGADLAKVGTTETTATINYFVYGTPDAEHPVLCHWRNGTVSAESQAFLNGLQGNDVETLRRADGIDHLEYHLRNPYLRHVTLVDTPGTGAVVDEHQDRTAEFMNLSSQLRERHSLETERIGSEADAVIYVVGAAARSSDQAFLEQLQQGTCSQSRPFNAVGVLSKVDLHEDLLTRRWEIADKIASQLSSTLNTVIPVSAGIERAIVLFSESEDRLSGIIEMVRGVSPALLEKMLDDDEVYLDEELDCPVPPARREEILGDLDWMVFTAVARVAANPALSPSGVLDELQKLAGFEQLRDVLERHFIRRGQFLRGYRILSDARKIVNHMRYQVLPDLDRQAAEDQARVERMLRFIRRADGDPAIAAELEQLVRGSVTTTDQVRRTLDDIDRAIAEVFAELDEYHADYGALVLIEDNPGAFSDQEIAELRPLLGLYGVEVEKRLPNGGMNTEYVEDRQAYWYERQASRNTVRRDVAERAVVRYGLILDAILEGEAA